jgi:hypothetical protein
MSDKQFELLKVNKIALKELTDKVLKFIIKDSVFFM